MSIVSKFLLNIFGLMTISTSGLGMFALQHVAGLPVIKAGLTLLPKYQCKIQSMMVAVTGSARLGVLFGHDRRVKTAPLLQPLRNGNMAFQAFGIACPLASFMA